MKRISCGYCIIFGIRDNDNVSLLSKSMKASWDAWIKLGRFPIVLRFLLGGVYNRILGVVLRFHDAMGLL